MTIAVVARDRESSAEIPGEFALHQNYPNPFNPTTLVSFELPVASGVRLEVFNVLGERVATLVDGELPPGSHALTFDAARLSSGVYFTVMRARGTANGEEFRATGRMLLTK